MHRKRSRLVAVAVLLAALLSTPGQALATYPDRNGLIVFTAPTDEGSQLFTIRPDGTGLRQITHVECDAIHADWSPDGRHIVFTVGCETSARLAIVRWDGSGFRFLPQPPGVFEDQASFSPDGRRIYFERFTIATNEDAIWSMKLNGRDQRRILGPFPNGFVTDPNVSPNGRKLSFQGWDGTVVGPPPNFQPAMGLFTADIDGSDIRQIRPFTADETVKADWAPNGRRIAVTENANLFDSDESANIFSMRPNGSRVRMLTDFDPGVRAYLGSYSPDGKWLVFRLENDDGLFGLFRMRPDGRHVREILPMSTFKPSLIDWGPSRERR
jgi:Tol biopolymer transport system component